MLNGGVNFHGVGFVAGEAMKCARRNVAQAIEYSCDIKCWKRQQADNWQIPPSASWN